MMKLSPSVRHPYSWCSLLVFSLLIPAAEANVTISGTRVIYPEATKEMAVRVNNVGHTPVLIQNWIDDGNANATPDKLNVPFILTPPMNRVDPAKGQSLRISYTGASLPADRESLFWLNVLEVPPTNPESTNRLQMAFRSRIKLFFRPKGLTADPGEAMQQIVWSSQAGRLVGKNNSPFYISLLSVKVSQAGKSETAPIDMVAPFSEVAVPAKALTRPVSTGAALSYEYINDWGAVKTTVTTVK